jgi:peptidyl-prolyl cis-trans isomerase SurA
MPGMRALHAAPLVVAAFVAFAPKHAAAEPPPSGVADRIVAVVGRDIILLSDVRAREAPFLVKLEQQKSPDAGKAALRAQMEKELLSRMVDEYLEAAFAAAGHVSVTPEEIDRAQATVAQQNAFSLAQLEEEAGKAGMTPPEYRAEIGRQVLEGKLLQVEVVPHLHLDPKVTEAERLELLEKERRHWLDELRRATHIDIRL